MKKRIIKAAAFLGKLLLALVILAAAGIGVLTALEYRPADTEPVFIQLSGSDAPRLEKRYTVMTWNLGYGALGDNADFFMDGGKGVRTADRERVLQNMEEISAAIRAENPDLCFLQETDRNSARSHYVDETLLLKKLLPGRAVTFASNFQAAFVPYPIPPIGKVDSGILTLSRFAVSAAERVQLPVPFRWPIRIVNLKRCLLVNRIPVVDTDKELVAINLHLEAYDDGEGKTAQTRQLLSLMQAEADKGNYVIVGGDFNQVFSNADLSAWPVRDGTWQPGVVDAADFGDAFTLLMDSASPTCRSLDQPLAGANRDDFQYYVIDGFIVSSNVNVVSLQTRDLGFTATDHNPVVLTFTLSQEE